MCQISNNSSKSQGRWTKQEHQKFVYGLQIYGKDWKKIQELLGTRNGAQIRSHAQKFFHRVKNQLDFGFTKQKRLTLEAFSSQKSQSSVLQQSQERNCYSYFLQKIVKKSSQKEKFDFWEAFIDQKNSEDLNEMETGICKRKNSFIAWDQYDLGLIPQNQPLKKVKTQ